MGIGDLAPGDPSAIGSYRLIGRLGAGGMGIVYLAIAPDSRAVAVKVLRPELTGDAVGRRRFAREVAALRRVRGPHLAEVVDADAEAATPYVVTRYIPGRRLSDVVAAEGALAPPQLLRLGTGLAQALSAVHAAGVVHRDLTPSNVLLVDGEPVVIDFGIAQAVDVSSLTGTGLVLGTVGYLAPEQVTRGEASPASDVFAWGATMAYAATGRPPFGTGRPETVLYRIAHEDPDLAGLPDQVASLVRAALARAPADRPAAAGLLAALGAGHTLPLVPPVPASRTSAAAEPVTALVPVREEPRTALLPTALVPAPPPAVPFSPGEPAAVLDRSPRRLWRAVLGLLLLAVVATVAAVAPVLVAVMVVALLPVLGTGAAAGGALARRRARRGSGPADPVLLTLALPVHLVRALLGAALAVGAAGALVALLAAPVVAVLGWRVLDEPEVGTRAALAVTAFSVLTLLAPGGGLARSAVGGLLHRGSFPARRGLVVGLLLLGAVLVAALVSSSSPVVWWPLHAPSTVLRGVG